MIGLSGLISMSRLLDHDALRDAVESQIRTVTGLDFVADGRIDVSVFPGSYVSFHGVHIKGSDAEAPALSVDVLTANLRLISASHAAFPDRRRHDAAPSHPR